MTGSMAEDSKIGTYEFVAEPFHVDFTGKLALGVLGNHLLNCAGFHASERGFGMVSLNENHYTWVLSRLAIELDALPGQYEKFVIRTWIEDVQRFFTVRNFSLEDREGKTIGHARSIWAMINMETRKPADLLALYGGRIADYICDKPCPAGKPGRIRVAATDPAAEYRVKYGDIDVNGHVNSMKYIEHVLDLFPLGQFEAKRVRRFEMAYVAESYYGDTLRFFQEEAGTDEYHIEVKKDGDETVARSKVIFEQIINK